MLGVGAGSGVDVGVALTGPDVVGAGVGVAVVLGRADVDGRGVERVGVGVAEVRLGDGAAAGVDRCAVVA